MNRFSLSILAAAAAVLVPGAAVAQNPGPYVVTLYRGITPDEVHLWMEIAELSDGNYAYSLVNYHSADGTIAPVALLTREGGKSGRCRLLEGRNVVAQACPNGERDTLKTFISPQPINFVRIPVNQSLAFGNRTPITIASAAERCRFVSLDHSTFAALPRLREAVKDIRAALPLEGQALSRSDLDRLIRDRVALQTKVINRTQSFDVIAPQVARLDARIDTVADPAVALRSEAVLGTVRQTTWPRTIAALDAALATAALSPTQATEVEKLYGEVTSCNSQLDGDAAAPGKIKQAIGAAVARNGAALTAAMTREFSQATSPQDLRNLIAYYRQGSNLAPLLDAGGVKSPARVGEARLAALAKAPKPAPAAAPTPAPAGPVGPGIAPDRAAVLAALVREAQTAFQSNPRYALQRWLETSSAVSQSTKMREDYDTSAGTITISNGDRTMGSYSFYRFMVSNVRCAKAPKIGGYDCQFDASVYANVLAGPLTIADATTPTARVRTPLVWSGDRWGAPVVRQRMIQGMLAGGGGQAQNSGSSSLCRSLNAGVAAAGGRSTSSGLDPQTWGC